MLNAIPGAQKVDEKMQEALERHVSVSVSERSKKKAYDGEELHC